MNPPKPPHFTCSTALVARAAGLSNAKQLGVSLRRETRANLSAYRRRFRAR